MIGVYSRRSRSSTPSAAAIHIPDSERVPRMPSYLNLWIGRLQYSRTLL